MASLITKANDYDINPVVIADFLSSAECERLQHFFHKGKNVSGKLRPFFRSEPEVPAAKSIRNNTICWLKQSKRTSWIYDRVRELMKTVNQEQFRFDVDDIQPIQLSEYKAGKAGGEFYRSHLDICTAANGSQRKLSLSVQLSHPDEYEGGDLLLFGDENDRIMDPENLQQNLFHRRRLGTAILFPSFFRHEITRVTKGKRYSLVAWLEGPNWR